MKLFLRTDEAGTVFIRAETFHRGRRVVAYEKASVLEDKKPVSQLAKRTMCQEAIIKVNLLKDMAGKPRILN